MTLSSPRRLGVPAVLLLAGPDGLAPRLAAGQWVQVVALVWTAGGKPAGRAVLSVGSGTSRCPVVPLRPGGVVRLTCGLAAPAGALVAREELLSERGERAQVLRAWRHVVT